MLCNKPRNYNRYSKREIPFSRFRLLVMRILVALVVNRHPKSAEHDVIRILGIVIRKLHWHSTWNPQASQLSNRLLATKTSNTSFLTLNQRVRCNTRSRTRTLIVPLSSTKEKVIIGVFIPRSINEGNGVRDRCIVGTLDFARKKLTAISSMNFLKYRTNFSSYQRFIVGCRMKIKLFVPYQINCSFLLIRYSIKLNLRQFLIGFGSCSQICMLVL